MTIQLLSSSRMASGLIRRSLVLPGITHSRPSFRNLASTLSMNLLKDLRSRSGAPIHECKKALEQTDGDLDNAMDWLRKHGAAKASSKLSGRTAQEGLVGALVSDKTTAAIVQVSAETDFAGRSQSFAELVEHITKATLQAQTVGSISDDVLKPISIDGKSVQSAMEEAIVAIRENLQITSATRCTAVQGQWVAYVHNRVTDSTGSSAAIVHVQGLCSENVLHEVGKKLAMHVVAARPLYLNPDSVPEIAIEKEKDVLRSQLANSGKSPEMLEKIVSGKMRKFYETVCLTEQTHMVEQDNPKVSKALEDSGVEVTRFEFLSIGG